MGRRRRTKIAEVSQLPDDAAAGDVLSIGNACRRDLPLQAPFDEITRVVDSARHGPIRVQSGDSPVLRRDLPNGGALWIFLHVFSGTQRRTAGVTFRFVAQRPLLFSENCVQREVPQYVPGHLIVSEILQECSSRAVRLSSADRMRRLEKEQHKVWAVTSQTREDKPLLGLRLRGAGNRR
jgi:hypothetical protein